MSPNLSFLEINEKCFSDKLLQMSENCIMPTVKHGGGAIMVWGYFGGEIAGDFVQIKGVMPNERDHWILLRDAIISDCHIIGENFVLQPNNDPKQLKTVYKLSKIKGSCGNFANHNLALSVSRSFTNWTSLRWNWSQSSSWTAKE